MASSQTRERILETSLAMFNAQGEPNVTTNHIADELEISPGNLYYHFRNKNDIVDQLFARYETRMDQALLVPDNRLPNLEDVWLQLHLVFANEGPLAERQLVRMPDNKVLYRLVCSTTSTARLLDGDGKELGRIAAKLESLRKR